MEWVRSWFGGGGGDGPAASDANRFKSSVPKKVFVKPAVLKDFSRAEISAHNTKDDCWLIVDNKVYDVSTYVNDHPGGDSIAKKAGQDNSAGFHGEQHGESVYALVEDYRIGNVAAD